VKKAQSTVLDYGPSVELELLLGLGPEDASLVVAQGERTLDLHPWLLDCVAVQLSCLGHQDEIPHSWDWENVLTLLEPGEELLYVLDHVRGDGNQTGRPFTLWLAIRFPRTQQLSSGDFDRRRKRSRMIVSQFQRQAFPGSDLSWVDPGELQNLLGFSAGSQQRCVCVSGLPSPRDIDDNRREVERSTARRNYQSLNDVAESLVDLHCDYRIAFVVERVDAGTLKDRLGQATQLRDVIHPYVRGTEQFGGNRGSNWSRQTSNSEGTSTSTQSSDSKGGTSTEQSSVGWGKSAWEGVKNIFHPIRRHKVGPRSNSQSWNRTTSVTEGESKTTTESASSGGSSAENWSTSNERLCSMLELADRSLERTISALHEAHGTGGYRWSAFILADGRNADLIGGALVGVLAGARTKDFPFNRFPVIGAGADLFKGTEPLLDLIAEAAPILPLPRACEALLLPEAELPGVRLRRNVFLGRTFSPPDEGSPRVGLGPDAFSALTGEDQTDSIEIPQQNLFRHILVAGATGSGKTTRVVEILNQLKDDKLSVVVFETAKRTYRARLQVRGRPAPLVYSLGSSKEYVGSRFRPLRLNPFYFELGTSLKRHIAVLSDALAELMPTEAMIGPLMRRAVEATYHERGWDIENGIPLDDSAPSWPTVLDFAAQVRALAQTLTYGAEVTANYCGALENRAALFVDATFQDLFSHGGNTPIDELFPLGRDVIVEVEDLPPSEVDIRAFVMTILLSRLRSVQGVRLERQRLCKKIVEREDQLFGTTPSESMSPPPSSSPTTTVGKLLTDYLASQSYKKKGERTRLLRGGHVKVSGKAVFRATMAVSSHDTVQIGGVRMWPRDFALPVPENESSSKESSQSIILPSFSLSDATGLSPRRWLVVIEEAHNVLDRSFEVRRPADESNAGRTLLRCIDRLLQEGREMDIGIMVVDQSPVNLARSVISNTGTKIVMRLEDGAEMEEIGRAIGLDESAWKKLGFLQEGEAIIKASYMNTPVKTTRFQQTTDGPKDTDPIGAGVAPSYTAIERQWRPILDGVQAPDERWLSEVMAACAGDVYLAGFVGAKLLLEERRNDAEALRHTKELRAMLAQPGLTGADLLCASQEAYVTNIMRGNQDALLAVVRLMVCALLQPAALDPAQLVVSSGIWSAADLLEHSNIGTSSKWRSLLLALARGGGDTWHGACQRMSDYASVVGNSDPTIPVRLLLERLAVATMNAPMRASKADPFDPVDLVLQVHAIVARVCSLTMDDSVDAGLVERCRALGDHLVRQLAIDLVSTTTTERVKQVDELLRKESYDNA